MAENTNQDPSGQGTVALGTFGTGNYHWDRLVGVDDTNGVQSPAVVNGVYVLDRITFPALGITGVINSVRLYGRFQIPNGALTTPHGKVGLYIGTTDYYAAEWAGGYADLTELYKEWTVSPATSAAFTVAELDAASYDIALYSGIEVEKGATIYAKCAQFWRVVNYTPAAGGTPQIIMT